MPKRKKVQENRISTRRLILISLRAALIYFIVYNLISYFLENRVDVVSVIIGLIGALVFFIIYYLVQVYINRKR